MRGFHYITAAMLTIVGSTGPALADFQERMEHCLTTFANPADPATVQLQCTASNGKLADCKVTQAVPADKGFEKAAICVADYLPMGSKSGAIVVPIRFPGGN